MKIVFDHQTFDLQRYGGISRYIFEIASHLARMPDCQVNVLAPLHINSYLQKIGRPVRKTAFYVGGIPKVRRLARAVNSIAVPLLMRRVSPHIIHRTYYASDFSAIPGARTVITVYDMIHERMSREMAYDPNTREKRRAVRDADHVICISEHTRQDLIEVFDIDSRKTSVVYLGFDHVACAGAADQQARGREFLLFVGQRGGYKNFSILLNAYTSSARLRERFDLVCFGGGAFNRQENADIAAAGVRAEAVRQIGGSDTVLRQLYESAAAFVYPSLYEGFGIPLLEAMSFDCPVICAPVTSIPEVVGDAARFFEPADVESLVAAIEHVVEDHAFRSDLIHRGRERLKAFSWQRCAHETLQIYRELAQ